MPWTRAWTGVGHWATCRRVDTCRQLALALALACAVRWRDMPRTYALDMPRTYALDVLPAESVPVGLLSPSLVYYMHCTARPHVMRIGDLNND